MKISTLQDILIKSPNQNIKFILSDGRPIPIHAHITEVGRIDKTFLDCGGTLRKISILSLQAWVEDDVDHRLPAGKLAEIIERAAPILGKDDLEVEIEYEEGLISQFPVESAKTVANFTLFTLGTKHTDCLAKEICLPKTEENSACCSGTSCCQAHQYR